MTAATRMKGISTIKNAEKMIQIIWTRTGKGVGLRYSLAIVDTPKSDFDVTATFHRVHSYLESYSYSTFAASFWAFSSSVTFPDSVKVFSLPRLNSMR